ncbi:AAA family ATPase [Candidatus Dojkabacteria bacterium]|nr:AAA family ATPase [Candidatus Dojkabacteria bacterium]
MKISKIEVKNNPVIGDLDLDFNFNGKIADNVLLIGNNGVGKTYLFENIIDRFLHNGIPTASDEIRMYEFQLNKHESENLKNITTVGWFHKGIKGKTIKLIMSNEGRKISFSNDNSHEYTDLDLGRISGEFVQNFKFIFSGAEPNYRLKKVSSITKDSFDKENFTAMSHDSQLGARNHQLLINTQFHDNQDLRNWIIDHPKKKIPKDVIDKRWNRLRKAFEKILPYGKNLKELRETKDGWQVYFEENGKDSSLENLSSGEKSLVHRTIQVLQNQEFSEGVIVSIDEPEKSLNPQTQIQLLNYFKELLNDQKGEQNGQIFMASHSPYLFKQHLQDDNTVIYLLSKDSKGIIKYKNIKDTQENLFPWSPSWGEVNYYAFDIPTVEFHNELYGYIEGKYRTDLKKLPKTKTWYNEKKKRNESVSLSTYIRHSIHHPENTANKTYSQNEFKKSITEMIKIVKSKKTKK